MPALKILIVEDEVLTAMHLHETLTDAGYLPTEAASNLTEALTIAAEQQPDLALIDIQLDGSPTSGITVARTLASRYHLPIIYLTAHSEDELFQAAKATSPAGYLLKPFRDDELKLQIELAWHNAQSALTDEPVADPFYLPIGGGYEKIDPETVLYLRADGAHVQIFLLDRTQPHHVSTNLGRLIPYFSSPNFYKLSRSLLININHIERLELNQLHMARHVHPVPIPVASRKELLSKLTLVRTK